jgi:hypothetical protein
VRGLRGGGGVRSRPGAVRTILFFHIISDRPSKQPRMVGSTLGVYGFGLICVSARTNKRHHHLTGRYVRLYSRRRLCARRGADAQAILRILPPYSDFGKSKSFQNAILLITKSLIPIQVPRQYRLSRRVNAYSGGVLARALSEVMMMSFICSCRNKK